ncbi:MAG: alpha/beta hydrolase [Clostridiaceae bacterium]|nr:alpha/beta hydrolase [Eubacteriales bacterium]
MQLTIDGLNLHYERQGSGKPVLILHGWGASIAAMRPVMNCMLRLGREAVALDFPGFGESAEPLKAWGVEDFAAITRKFIAEQGIYGCDCIAHSHGGRVAIYLASEEKSLFHKLVLVDAAGVKPKRSLKYYLKVWSYKLGVRLAKISLLDRAFHISERQKNAGSEDYRNTSGTMRQTFVRLVNTDLTDRLPMVENETLLVWGENDADTPLYMAELMQKRMKSAGLAVLKGAGHFSYADDYPRFCAMMDVLFKERT